MLQLAGVWLKNGVTWHQQKADLGLALRVIPIHNSILMEELTWLEIRDRISGGYDTVLVPTGGIEQNGPFVITGKHNKIVAKMAEEIANELGHTLVAPVIPFVPQGSLSPPAGHMQYPGTIGVSENTYYNLLRDITMSLKLDGFTNIVLLGDSGGNQKGLKRIEKDMNKEWKGSSTQVIYLSDYYANDKWSYKYLKEIGVEQIPDVNVAVRNDVHSDYHYESILAFINPVYVRYHERALVGQDYINGVALTPIQQTRHNGKLLIDYRVDISVKELMDRIKR